MPHQHANGLTPAEAERLAFLVEELGEVQQAIGKILRHGYASTNPLAQDSPTNRQRLVSELGDLTAIIGLMIRVGDVCPKALMAATDEKLKRLPHWSHHQHFV